MTKLFDKYYYERKNKKYNNYEKNDFVCYSVLLRYVILYHAPSPTVNLFSAQVPDFTCSTKMATPQFSAYLVQNKFTVCLPRNLYI